jgi:polar amino acid transport system permease protein
MTDPDGSMANRTDPPPEGRQPERAAALKTVPVRHPGRWVATGLILVLIALLINTLFFSSVVRGGVVEGRFQWPVVGKYLFARPVLRGIGITLELTAIAMAVGIVMGVLLAIMRLSRSRILSGAAWIYIWFFRGTPVYVQLFFWYVGIAYLYPKLTLGIPFGPAFYTVNANTLITSFVAAALGLSLNEGAYMAEIVRAGIISVDEGQTEAAQSLGMTKLQTMRRIVLPQAMRIIIPPTGNETISMLKTTSLVYAIAVTDLFTATQNISNTNYQIVPLLVVASLWYLFFTSVLTIGQYYVERYYARGSARTLPPTPIQRLRQSLFRIRVEPAPPLPEAPWVAPHG